MNKLNRKAFIGIVLGSSVMVWFSQSRLIRSKLMDPDLPFLKRNRQLLGALCDLIIPPTDTPGALETATPDFIINYVEKCLLRSEQVIFIEGLKNAETLSRSSFGKSFIDCPPAARNQILEIIEKNDRPYPGILGKAEHKIFGKSFFTQLKEYTVLGFCTSEAGAKKALGYDPIPGAYKGCVTWKGNRPAWYTQ